MTKEKYNTLKDLKNEAYELMKEQYKSSAEHSSLLIIDKIIKVILKNDNLGHADLGTFRELIILKGFEKAYEYTIKDTIDEMIARICLDLLAMEKAYNMVFYYLSPIYTPIQTPDEHAFEGHMLYVIEQVAHLIPEIALNYIYRMYKGMNLDLIELMKLRLEYDKYIRTK